MKKQRSALQDWLYFAGQDLQAAHILLKEGIFAQTCFHAHQCVEKSLKAVLVFHQAPVPKIHDLKKLFLLCLRYEELLKVHQRSIADLNPFYIPTRYPDALPGALPDRIPGKGDAKQAVKIAEEVHQTILDLLK